MPYLGYFEPKIQKYPLATNFHIKTFLKNKSNNKISQKIITSYYK